jgi:hypothetical protein
LWGVCVCVCGVCVVCVCVCVCVCGVCVCVCVCVDVDMSIHVCMRSSETDREEGRAGGGREGGEWAERSNREGEADGQVCIRR